MIVRISLLMALLSATATATPFPERPATPAAIAPFTLTAPAVTTASGLKIVHVERSMLPLVRVTVEVQAGSELDPAGQPGLAALTARALEEAGAGVRTPREVAEAIDDLGAELEVKCDHAGVTFEMAVESSRLAAALALLGDIVARPRFDETELIAIRARQIDDRKRQLDDPREMANDALSRALYGTHPYAHPILGSLPSIGALKSSELKAFWAAHYGPRTTTVVLVGDTGKAALEPLIASAFGGWKSTAGKVTAVPSPTATTTKIVIVDKPGAPQSEVRIGELGEAWSSPHLAALALVEMALGGSFTSRLTQNLREKHGYTYGITADWELERGRGLFMVKSALRTDVTAAGIAEILKELAAIRTPIPDAELAKSRVMISAKFLKSWGTERETAALLADLAAYDQSVDVLNRMIAETASLGSAAVAVVAGQIVRPAELVIVIVGDRKVIEPSLRALSLPMEVVPPVQ